MPSVCVLDVCVYILVQIVDGFPVNSEKRINIKNPAAAIPLRLTETTYSIQRTSAQ